MNYDFNTENGEQKSIKVSRTMTFNETKRTYLSTLLSERARVLHSSKSII